MKNSVFLINKIILKTQFQIIILNVHFQGTMRNLEDSKEAMKNLKILELMKI